MCRRLVYLVSCVLVLGAACSAYAAPEGLIAHWTFDEGQGTTAYDSSGNGNDGTLNGDPQWVEGIISGALDFDGTGDYVDCGNDEIFDLTDAFTAGLWINWRTATGDWQAVIAKGDNSWRIARGAGTQTMDFGFDNGDRGWAAARTASDVPLNEWHHVAATIDTVEGAKIYLDGVLEGTNADTGGISSGGTNYAVWIGNNSQQTARFWDGLIDDVQIYNRVLSAAEIGSIMKGLTSPALASGPRPQDEAIDVPRDVSLAWTPGESAATHDVYLGTVSQDVNNASTADPLGVLVSPGQAAATYDPPSLLDYGQTYYWRIDEVNAAPDNTIFKGDVWSFTVEPLYYLVPDVNASTSLVTGPGAGDIGVTVDGSGLADGQHGVGDADMWLGVGTAGDPAQIQYDFDRVYKLYGIHLWNYNGMYEGFLGFGVKDITIEYATEPNEWMPLGDFEVDQASSKATYAGQIIDLDGLAAQSIRITIRSNRSAMQPWSFGLSEIWFLYKPVFAREPNPDDGATRVDRGTSLSWRAGREAVSHLVYLDTDSNAVADGEMLVDTVAAATYDPGALALGQTYYWRVDEVNDAETPSAWDSAVWSFVVQEYVPIEDFESYTDDEGSRIFDVWLDGYGVPANGSLVGHENPPYAETTIAHSGQAMPLYYDNIAGVANSEAELAFTPAQDWTSNGADTLSLYYRGHPAGFVQISESNIIMNGTGVDIWGTTDEFRFVYKQLTGNGSIIARIESLDYTNEWAKAGVMIRQTLDSDSVLVDGIISADGNVGMQWRTARAVDMGSPDTSNASADGGATLPGWVKLTRTGNVFEVQYSTDGVTWQDIVPETAGDPQTVTLVMTDPVYIGLAVTSHAAGLVTGSQLTGIATTGNVTGAWQSASIGVDQPAGNGIDTFYLTVEDTSGQKVTLTNPSAAAVAAGVYQQWAIPLSDITAAGVKTNSVKKLYLGVGDKTQPSKNASGILYIDDIAFGHPIAAE